MTNFEIFNVERDDVNQPVPMYYIDYNKPDGTKHRHMCPVDTLAWRAVEYGIDPADVETLIDVIVHEPFIPDPAKNFNKANDAAARRGFIQTSGDPITLLTASSTDQAREAHLARIAEVKKTRDIKLPARKKGLAASKTTDVLAVVRADTIDPDKLQNIKDLIESARTGRKPTPPQQPKLPMPKGVN